MRLYDCCINQSQFLRVCNQRNLKSLSDFQCSSSSEDAVIAGAPYTPHEPRVSDALRVPADTGNLRQSMHCRIWATYTRVSFYHSGSVWLCTAAQPGTAFQRTMSLQAPSGRPNCHAAIQKTTKSVLGLRYGLARCRRGSLVPCRTAAGEWLRQLELLLLQNRSIYSMQ